MRQVVALAMRFRVLVLGAAAAVLAVSVVQLPGAPVDELPEFTPPEVQIQTEANGLSAAEVEQLITLGLEQDLLNGVPWLDRIHSSSMPGLSVIDLTFQPGTDLYAARQQVLRHFQRPIFECTLDLGDVAHHDTPIRRYSRSQSVAS